MKAGYFLDTEISLALKSGEIPFPWLCGFVLLCWEILQIKPPEYVLGFWFFFFLVLVAKSVGCGCSQRC